MDEGDQPDPRVDRSVRAGNRDWSGDVTGSFGPHQSELRLETDIAPSFPGVFRTFGSPPTAPASPRQAGELEGDFEIIRELGRGASGVVYLVRQISLAREVALKITRDLGVEAKTMAMLQHRHIVPVYSESRSTDGQLRLICMQFVPGITLDDLIEYVRIHRIDAKFDVQTLIDSIRTAQMPPLAAENHQHQHDCTASHDFVQWACLFMADVAEALAYAHRQGVLHLDVKPANILIDDSGHPLLADFSLSLPPAGRFVADSHVFGGTPPYMAPEHLDALNPGHPAPSNSVDQRSDIYALGLVLYEILARQRSHPPNLTRTNLADYCQQLSEYRRQSPLELTSSETVIPRALNWTLAKCLAPEPGDRFQTAGELASALRGCRQLSTIVAGLSNRGCGTLVGIGTIVSSATFGHHGQSAGNRHRRDVHFLYAASAGDSQGFDRNGHDYFYRNRQHRGNGCQLGRGDPSRTAHPARPQGG